MVFASSACTLIGCLIFGGLQHALGNYPPVTPETVWCSVPNYRYYRWTVTKARGYPITASLTCAETLKPDGCTCADSAECMSGYCISSSCSYPIFQVAELEFWRSGRKVETQKVPDTAFDAYRVVNMVEVHQTWGVWELEFYSDTSCTELVNGTVIFSSAMARGFGHSIDHTAPLGAHDTARTRWQSRPYDPPQTFDLHGPAMYAFDGNITTNWWADCRPCLPGTQWLGLSFAEAQPVKCIRIMQDKDHDYASFSLALEGRDMSTGSWVRVTTFNAATYAYGGVWEQLSVPQGAAFLSDLSHARVLDGNLNSSVMDLVGFGMEFDFGVETEVDGFRWATALEPSDDIGRPHDGRACHFHGLCFRDPVQWTLEGSLDRSTWELLHSQTTDFVVPIYRTLFVELQPLHHQVSLDITDIWPDGRGKCAVRR